MENKKQLAEIAQDIVIKKAIAIANEYSTRFRVDQEECMFEAITASLEFKKKYSENIDEFEPAFNKFCREKVGAWVCNELNLVVPKKNTNYTSESLTQLLISSITNGCSFIQPEGGMIILEVL